MKKTDYSKMNDDELRARMSEFHEEMAAGKLKFRLGQFKRTSEFPRLRKEIARVQTALKQRELQAASESK